MVLFIRSLLLESFLCVLLLFFCLDDFRVCFELEKSIINSRGDNILKVQWYEWINGECMDPRKKSNNNKNLKNKKRNNNNQVRNEKNQHFRFITLFGNGIVSSFFFVFSYFCSSISHVLEVKTKIFLNVFFSFLLLSSSWTEHTWLGHEHAKYWQIK